MVAQCLAMQLCEQGSFVRRSSAVTLAEGEQPKDKQQLNCKQYAEETGLRICLGPSKLWKSGCEDECSLEERGRGSVCVSVLFLLSNSRTQKQDVCVCVCLCLCIVFLTFLSRRRLAKWPLTLLSRRLGVMLKVCVRFEHSIRTSDHTVVQNR